MSGSHFRNRITVKRPIPWNYNTTKINPSQLLILTLWITIHNFTLEVAIALLVFVPPASIPAPLLPSSPHCHHSPHHHYHGTTTTIVTTTYGSFLLSHSKPTLPHQWLPLLKGAKMKMDSTIIICSNFLHNPNIRIMTMNQFQLWQDWNWIYNFKLQLQLDVPNGYQKFLLLCLVCFFTTLNVNDKEDDSLILTNYRKLNCTF